MKGASVYLRLGWKLVPLHGVTEEGACTCAKGAECPSAGKHPRITDWVDQASDDPEVVATWGDHGNIGVATGHGFFVLDVDPRNGGQVPPDLPRTVQAVTPSGGAHYFFKMIPGVTNSAGKIGPGLDIRGIGGQVAVAPSQTAKGPYRWVNPPWNTEFADAPGSLVEALSRAPALPASTERGFFPAASRAVLDAARDALETHGPAVEGSGGDLHTFRAAALLVHDFALTDDEAWPLLTEWNEGCQPPWEETELRAKLSGGGKYGKAEYGCRRTLDSVETARKLIIDWQTAGSGEAEMLAMVDRVRRLPFDDPTKRQLVLNDLMGATSMGAQALALPRARVRAAAVVTPSSGYDLSTTGQPHANLNNALICLEQTKRLIWWDEFQQRVQTPEGEWSDADDLALTVEMQRRLGLTKMPLQIVQQAVQAYAHQNRRDVVRETLERFEWDGVERIAGFLSAAFGAEPSDYTSSASTNFWRSLVARALQPGCKVDTMIVLEGDQGIKKSTGLREIAGAEFFAEASESPHSKDFFLALQGKLIVEVAEMDAFSRSEVTAVKRVLSCQIDRFRAPYERTTRDWPRRGVFVGTTNRSDWARDDTGARRFWPITCRQVDLEWIREHREQLFAEAVETMDQGWWDMPAEATAAEQEARWNADPWEDLVADYLKDSDGEVRVIDLLKHPLGLETSRIDRPAQMRVASILKRLGFGKRDSWHAGRKSKLWVRL